MRLCYSIIGRITVLAVRPSVCLSVCPIGAPILKRKRRQTKITVNVPNYRVNRVLFFCPKNEKSFEATRPIGWRWSPFSEPSPRRQLTLPDHEYGTTAPCGVPVYAAAFAGTYCAYPRKDGQAELTRPDTMAYRNAILFCSVWKILHVVTQVNKSLPSHASCCKLLMRWERML